MNVKFLDLTRIPKSIQGEINKAVLSVIEKGIYVLGDQVHAFEEEYAEYIGTKYCISVGNGLDALTFSLIANGIGAGDEVIVPAHTFIATWLAVSEVGATPISVDISAETYNLDPALIEGAISDRTKCILPVHLYGQAAELESIKSICDRYDLKLIEDAAQAQGAAIGELRCGAVGIASATSFYPGKNLGGFGDGGAVTTDDKNVFDIVKRLRNYGSDEKYIHKLKGRNSRLDEIQAAVLRVKLRYLDEWNERRRDIADVYIRNLDDTKCILPKVGDKKSHVWHLFVVQTEDRDSKQAKLKCEGIDTLVHYPIPPFKQECYKEFGSPNFYNAISVANKALSLPLSPFMAKNEIDYVVEKFNSL